MMAAFFSFKIMASAPLLAVAASCTPSTVTLSTMATTKSSPILNGSLTSPFLASNAHFTKVRASCIAPTLKSFSLIKVGFCTKLNPLAATYLPISAALPTALALVACKLALLIVSSLELISLATKAIL